MSAGRQRYLVAYDIRDDKRLRQVHKTIKGYGWAMQYSVFICDLDRMEYFALMGDLGAAIHHGLDSVAIIALGDPRERGRSCFEFLGVAPILPTAGSIVI